MANRDDAWSESSSGGGDRETAGDNRNVEDELDEPDRVCTADRETAGDDGNVEDELDEPDQVCTGADTR